MVVAAIELGYNAASSDDRVKAEGAVLRQLWLDIKLLYALIYIRLAYMPVRIKYIAQEYDPWGVLITFLTAGDGSSQKGSDICPGRRDQDG